MTQSQNYFCHYTIYSRGSLNAVSQRREFPGALIRFNDGIGCLHPWPEFGDASVDDQLKLLREGGSTRVIERALRMAAVDGAARRRGVSLFEDLKIPPSHYSWDQNQPVESQMRRVVDEGWRAIKMKGFAKIDETLATMGALFDWLDEERDLPSPRRKTPGTSQVPLLDAPWLRMDFNSCLTEQAFAAFLNSLPPHWRRQVDFIEDPFPFEAGRWSAMRRDHNIRLARDKQLKGATAGFDVAVMKPGRRDWRDILPNLPGKVKIVMTSAMDHAIGQCFAAYEAALAWKECGDRMDLCGLCTEHLFEKDEFFERIRSHRGILEVDRGGTGLGFDALVANVEWKKL